MRESDHDNPDEGCVEVPSAAPRTELMMLQELAKETGAIYKEPEGVWHLPFYLKGGDLLMLPVDEWIRQRKVAGGWFINIGLQLPCGCLGHCHGHPSAGRSAKPIPGATLSEVFAQENAEEEFLREDALYAARKRAERRERLSDQYESEPDDTPPWHEDRTLATEPPNDNWQHRGKTMQCRTCMFYVPKAESFKTTGPEIGRCRERSPTIKGWPAIYPSDWCGAHKMDENKL